MISSSLLSRNWYIRNGEVIDGSSHTFSLPPSVLPNLRPSARRSSGDVIPSAGSRVTLRTNSAPAVMLPHWSEPPSCRVQP